MNNFRNAENTTPGDKPKAYLNWILLDEQLQYVAGSSGADLIKDTGNIYALTSDGPVTMTKNGFLYIYVSNETQNRDVFFDNLVVQHYTGPIVEETHYYPFGLTMAGISSKAAQPNYIQNDKKYNGIEFEGDMGIDIYDAQLRELDPQVGRWWQVDPKTENMEMWSPYASNYDNPIRYSDPLGDEGEDCCGGFMEWVNERLDNAKENFRREAAWVRDGLERGWDNAVNNIKSGQSIPQRMWAEFKENPLSAVGPVGPVGPVSMEVNAVQKALTLESNVTKAASVESTVAKTASTAETTTVVASETKAGITNIPTIKDQALKLKELNAGKNSITIRTPSQQIRYDLDGKAHGVVPTPHKQLYRKNFLNGQLKSISREGKDAKPLTQQDIRIIRKFIENITKQKK